MDDIAHLWAKLGRLLRHRGRSREDTEDMVQDAFVRLQTYCTTAEVHEREAFLVRTALNLEIDQQRRERYRLFVPNALEELPRTFGKKWEGREGQCKACVRLPPRLSIMRVRVT